MIFNNFYVFLDFFEFNKNSIPRYHSKPVKLLETRQGRCGEWANCFTLILRSFGFQTRRVLDWTDHVWCEFYSDLEHRWIHVDPCEGTLDKPKVYDHGWGKKLTYVIATSIEEIQDVTKRYVIDRDALKKRRLLVREE
jgi:peptide-N4-(N-acetyl-beta-glucosaminyl)asparagine amidase